MTTLPEGAYWRVRCLLAEAQAEEWRAKWAVARAADKARAALVDAGLDPSRAYQWHDATCAVLAVDPPSHE